MSLFHFSLPILTITNIRNKIIINYEIIYYKYEQLKKQIIRFSSLLQTYPDNTEFKKLLNFYEEEKEYINIIFINSSINYQAVQHILMYELTPNPQIPLFPPQPTNIYIYEISFDFSNCLNFDDKLSFLLINLTHADRNLLEFSRFLNNIKLHYESLLLLNDKIIFNGGRSLFFEINIMLSIIKEGFYNFSKALSEFRRVKIELEDFKSSFGVFI